MEPDASHGRERIRLLGLGNEILADDAFGILVARKVERLIPWQIEVVCSSASGFGLLEDLLGTSLLVVVDTIVTGAAPPGTVHVFRLDRMRAAPCVAPHFLGLVEVLAAARQLHLDVPEVTTVVAVEAADCMTLGGGMHAAVRAAIPGVVDRIRNIVANRCD
jgi:hydrogenase maturation protease